MIGNKSPLLIASMCYESGILYDFYDRPYIHGKQSYTEIVRLLLEYMCDPNICNDRNKSPLLIACERGLTDIVKLLLQQLSKVPGL